MTQQQLHDFWDAFAGSIVTKDIPANCVAVGNPCRVKKFIEND